jgi:hypothetical protein
MNQGMMNTVISAIVGGVVGAGVVFFAGGSEKMDLKNVEIADLKVERLVVAEQATFLNEAGNPVVGIKDGSIITDHVVVAKKFVGQQLQGHAIVANRLFTTPDNLMQTPMDQWRFYAEIGSSAEHGGEVVVRSATGAARVGQATAGGTLLRAGFDTESKPQIVAIQNLTRSVMPLSYDLSDEQKRMLSGPAIQPGAFDNSGAAPYPGYTNPAVANPAPPAGTYQPVQ